MTFPLRLFKPWGRGQLWSDLTWLRRELAAAVPSCSSSSRCLAKIWRHCGPPMPSRPQACGAVRKPIETFSRRECPGHGHSFDPQSGLVHDQKPCNSARNSGAIGQVHQLCCP